MLKILSTAFDFVQTGMASFSQRPCWCCALIRPLLRMCSQGFLFLHSSSRMASGDDQPACGWQQAAIHA
jgi:hypothetical protein